MYRALYYGASPDVFVNGDLGIGWIKVSATAAPAWPLQWQGTVLRLAMRLAVRPISLRDLCLP